MISLLLVLMAQVEGETPTLSAERTPALTATISVELPQPGSVTLAQLLEAADKQNLDRRISVEQHRRSEAEVKQAWTALLPSLSVQAGWVHNQYPAELAEGTFGPGSPAVTITPQDQLDLAARVELPLIDTAKWMRTAAAEAARDGLAAREKLSSDLVKRAITTGWYQYAAAIALRTSSARSVAVSEAQAKLQDIRQRAGAATELELLRATAEVERNRQSVADADRLIAIARRNLQTLSGMDPGDGARLPEADLRPLAPLAEFEAHVDELPAVRAAEQDVRGAEKISTASKLALVPLVSAQFTERVSNASGFTGEASSFNFGVNLAWRLDVPTFIAMDVQAHNVAIASLGAAKARLQARDQINTDWQTIQAALIKVQATKAQVGAAQRARDVAAARYNAGASTQLDVIQADRDLFSAEVLQIQAQSDLASARVALQLSAGLPIDENLR